MDSIGFDVRPALGFDTCHRSFVLNVLLSSKTQKLHFFISARWYLLLHLLQTLIVLVSSTDL